MFDRAGSRKYLNAAERAAFFRVAKAEPDPFKRTLCLVLFFTGCRVSEALNCTWERVDFNGRAVVFETLKRRKRGHFRSVPLPQALMRDLRELETPTGSNARIWPISRATAYRWVRAKMAAAGIFGSRGCPKGLRHSHAVACIAERVPLTVVKKWLGHARLETTAVYLDVLDEEERDLAKRLWRGN